MTELDGELPETVLEIIEEFGKTLTYIVTKGEGHYNYDTQTTSAEEVAKLEDIKMTPPEGYSSYLIGNSNGLIESGDYKAILPSLYFSNKSVQPSNEDLATWDGKDWVVKNVEPIFSGEIPCAYQIQFRSA